MPAFIKTPADENRWAKAKKVANKTLSESDGDSYWALTNSIYQKMTKSFEDIEALEAVLTKARRRLSDEPEEDEADVSPEEAGMREFDPDTEQDDADKWLAENEPKGEKEEHDAYEEVPDVAGETAPETQDPEAEAGSPAERNLPE